MEEFVRTGRRKKIICRGKMSEKLHANRTFVGWESFGGVFGGLREAEKGVLGVKIGVLVCLKALKEILEPRDNVKRYMIFEGSGDKKWQKRLKKMKKESRIDTGARLRK